MHRVQITHVTPRYVSDFHCHFHSYMFAQIHTHTVLRTLILIRTRANTSMHAQTDTQTNAWTHTHAHTQKDTHACTHTETPLTDFKHLNKICRRHRIWNCRSRYPSLLSRQEIVREEGSIRTLNNGPQGPLDWLYTACTVDRWSGVVAVVLFIFNESSRGCAVHPFTLFPRTA